MEPKPPRGHQDSRSPDEIAVDSALEEGLRELREHATVTFVSRLGRLNIAVPNSAMECVVVGGRGGEGGRDRREDGADFVADVEGVQGETDDIFQDSFIAVIGEGGDRMMVDFRVFLYSDIFWFTSRIYISRFDKYDPEVLNFMWFLKEQSVCRVWLFK